MSTATIQPAPALAAPPSFAAEDDILHNGDHLDAKEFLRRYERMGGVKKAELIEGIVFMPSPVRVRQHGIPDNLSQMWLGIYAAFHSGTLGVKWRP